MRTTVPVLAAVLVLGSLASPAGAATPEAKCYTAQLKAMATICAAHAKCWAVATKADAANAWVEKELEAKPLAKITKAEAGFACIVEGAPVFEEATSGITGGMTALHDLLDPTGLGNGCGAKKLSAAGKFCAAFLQCHATDFATAGTKPAPGCIAKATDIELWVTGGALP